MIKFKKMARLLSPLQVAYMESQCTDVAGESRRCRQNCETGVMEGFMGQVMRAASRS
jgi:hypothetical protein